MGKASITIAIDGKWSGKGEITAATSDLGRLSKAVSGTAGQMASYLSQQEASAKRISRLAASTSKSTSQALAEFGNGVVEQSGRLWQLGDSMQSLGQSMTRSVTAPLVALAAGAGEAAVGFDTAMADLRKTSDLTESQLKKLGDAAVELSTKQPVTAEAIVGVEALGAQLGVAEDRLQDFALTVTGLDIATDMGAEDAATEMARFANIVGMAEEEFSNYGSTLVAIGNNMATTESEVSNMAQRFASAGHQAGLSEAEILGLSASMSALGMRAEAGGSALSQVFVSISKAVSEGGASLDAFAGAAGVSAEQFASAWRDNAADAFASLLQGIHDSSEAGKDMNETLGELGITQIRQSDVMRRMAGSVGEVTEALDLSRGAWEENTALQAEVDQRNESMASRLQVLANKVEAIAIKVGGPLVEAVISAADAMSPAIQAVADMATAFAEADEGTQQLVIGAAAVAAASGPALDVLGGFAKVAAEVGASFGHLAQDTAVYEDAMATVDGAQMRAYKSAGTTAAGMGLLKNKVAEAAGGVDRYVETWEGWYSASREVEKKSAQLADVTARLSAAQETGGRAAEKMAGKLRVQESALKRQVDAAKQVRDANEGLMDGWKRSAGAVDELGSSTVKSAGLLTKLKDGAKLVGGEVLGMVANFAKMSAVTAVVGLVAAAIADLVARQEEARRRQEDLAAASRTLADVQNEASESARSQAEGISDIAEACEESLQGLIDLNEQAAETMSGFEVDSATLGEYISIIDELTGKSSLSVAEQGRLTAAVEGYNKITGETVSVVDAATGTISTSTDELHRNADAWRRNAEMQAYQQLAGDYMKANVEATMELERAQEELSGSQRRYNELIERSNEAISGGAQLTAEESRELETLSRETIPDLTDAVESAQAAYDSTSESLEYATTKMGLLSDEAAKAADAYSGFVASSNAASLAEAGVDVDALAERLRYLGADTEALAALTGEQVAAVAAAYDGSVDSVVAALEEQGVAMGKTAQQADADARHISDVLSLMAGQAGLDLAGMGVDLSDLSERMRDSGLHASDLAGLSSERFAEMAASCGGDIDALIADIQEYNAQEMAKKSTSVKVDTSDIAKASESWASTRFADKYARVQVSVAGGGNFTPTRLAAGGVRVRRHAEGVILNRPTVLGAVDVAGEAGAEAVIPLTNRRYVRPFARTVAEEMGRLPSAPRAQVVNNYYLSVGGGAAQAPPKVERLLAELVAELGQTAGAGARY